MRIWCLCIGFLFGSVPSGAIVARAKGVDLRHIGSGNVGSTNVLRGLGRKYAVLTLVMDMLKSIVPILITQAVWGADQGVRYIVLLYTGLGAVLGHDFSPWLHFRGGKGVATSGGMVLMTDPVIFVIDFVTIFLAAAVTGYVSLGSILAAVFYFLFNVYVVLTGMAPGWNIYPLGWGSEAGTGAGAMISGASQATGGPVPAGGIEILIVSGILAALCIWRHRANIGRLLDGTENKIRLF